MWSRDHIGCGQAKRDNPATSTPGSVDFPTLPGFSFSTKNRQFRQKRKTRKRRKINASGSRSGGIIALRLPATSIGATAHRADRLFRLRNPPTRFPPPEVVGGFPHGLLVPNQRFCRFFRLSPSASSEYRQMPVVAGFSRLFPCFSGSHSS